MGATLSQIWRYPVKSMIGETLTTAQLATSGIEGDRGWAVRDDVRGGIRGAKKIGPLMRLGARYRNEPGGVVDIVLPDGSTVSTEDSDVSARVSSAIEHQVTLFPLQPASDVDHYRRGAPDSVDMLVELNSVFGREAGEPLPDFSIFPPEIMEFESPVGTYFDAFPLLVMSTSALASIQADLPDSAIDVRRFRPNLVIDTAGAVGHPEFDWVGRTMKVGGAVIRIGVGCPRCVMITRAFDNLPEDRPLMRYVVRELDQNVGVYATIVEPGTLGEGDVVTLVG